MTRKTIAELKSLFHTDKVDDTLIQSLQKDDRKGVQQLIRTYRKRQIRQEELKEMFQEMCIFEKQGYAQGFQFIAGVDEAGRGPLAGPVVAAAVILPHNFELLGLNDSKQLSESKRNTYFAYIKEHAISYGIGIVNNEVIDKINIFNATKLAMTKAIHSLSPTADYVLIDAVKLDNPGFNQEVITKGDEKSVSIAAASILAKVTRDKLMQKIHFEYPYYDFSSNMGYGTKNHLYALEKHGLTPYHRKSFTPVKNVL
ncbi:ribonuclease HII [Cerasibacillus terrae]|uniref:Ribonuclease HII n=1 Tax=Cerasibacillus terrae TaxID=2498845 RepID=A0A5C8P316_9BACI|nr:ribonuclease HII [Cerasibacillus terrae]TXL67664.1 ribonuclease HII [Cerasibacillus terrae]